MAPDQLHPPAEIEVEAVEMAIELTNKGRSHATSGHLDDALNCFRESAKIREKQLLSLADSYQAIGDVLSRKGDFRGALIEYQKSLKARLLESSQTLEIASSYNQIGATQDKLEYFGEAVASYRRAVELYEASRPGSKGSADLHEAIGFVLKRQGDGEGAKSEFLNALSIYESLEPASTKTANLHREIGMLFYERGDLDVALFEFHQTLKIWQQTLSNHLELADLYNLIGSLHFAKGDVGRALHMHRRALDTYLRLGHETLDLSASYGCIGGCLFCLGDYRAALLQQLEALRIQIKLAPISDQAAASFNNIGLALECIGNFPGSLKHYYAAVAGFELLEPESKQVADLHDSIGHVLCKMGIQHGALDEFDKAISIREKLEVQSQNGGPTPRSQNASQRWLQWAPYEWNNVNNTAVSVMNSPSEEQTQRKGSPVEHKQVHRQDSMVHDESEPVLFQLGNQQQHAEKGCDPRTEVAPQTKKNASNLDASKESQPIEHHTWATSHAMASSDKARKSKRRRRVPIKFRRNDFVLETKTLHPADKVTPEPTRKTSLKRVSSALSANTSVGETTRTSKRQRTVPAKDHIMVDVLALRDAPESTKMAWSENEDAILRSKRVLGIFSWGEIAVFLPNRSARECRNRFDLLMQKPKSATRVDSLTAPTKEKPPLSRSVEFSKPFASSSVAGHTKNILAPNKTNDIAPRVYHGGRIRKAPERYTEIRCDPTIKKFPVLPKAKVLKTPERYSKMRSIKSQAKPEPDPVRGRSSGARKQCHRVFIKTATKELPQQQASCVASICHGRQVMPGERPVRATAIKKAHAPSHQSNEALAWADFLADIPETTADSSRKDSTTIETNAAIRGSRPGRKGKELQRGSRIPDDVALLVRAAPLK